MKPEDINYEPLKSLKHATLSFMNNTWSGALWFFAFLLAVVVVWLTFKFYNPMALFLAIFIFSGLIGHFVRKFKNSVWGNFAAVNGWGLDTETPVTTLIPASLQYGHSQHTSSVIQAQLGEFACDILSYDTTTGYGRDSDTDFYVVAIVKLSKPLPHIVLQANKNGVTGSRIQEGLQDAQVLKLEGDFGKYFTLKIERDQQIDALTVLTPDVMQDLVDYSQNEDIEIIGDNLYFIVSGDKRDSMSVEQLIKSVVELSRQLLENARLTGDVPISASTQQVMQSGSFMFTPSPLSPSALFKMPNPSRSDLVAGVVIGTILAVLFIWAFIQAKNYPQY